MSENYDFLYLQGGVELLEDYLLSGDLYRAINGAAPPGAPAFPSLTPSGLLLAQQRLASQSDLSSSAQAVLAEFNRLRAQWRTAWEKKVLKDLTARLTQWGAFLEEYRSQRAENAGRYAYEVRLRVMIDLLAQALPELPAEIQNRVTMLDTVLQANLQPGGFIWQPELQEAFPALRFAYLYASLKKAP